MRLNICVLEQCSYVMLSLCSKCQRNSWREGPSLGFQGTRPQEIQNLVEKSLAQVCSIVQMFMYNLFLLVLFQSVGLISCPFQDLITKMLWSEKESTSAWSQKNYEIIVMSIICIKVLKYASDQPPPQNIKMEYIRGAAKAGLNVEAGITRASSISPLSLWTAFQWWPRSKWNPTHIWFLWPDSP